MTLSQQQLTTVIKSREKQIIFMQWLELFDYFDGWIGIKFGMGRVIVPF